MNESFYQNGFYISSTIALVEGLWIYHLNSRLENLKAYIKILDDNNLKLSQKVELCLVRIKRLEKKYS